MFPLYQRKLIVFGCQSACKFELPLYVSSVLFVHGALFVFDAIPDECESVVKNNKNNTNNFFIVSPFSFLPLPCGGAETVIAVSGAGFPQGMEPSIRLRVAPPRLRRIVPWALCDSPARGELRIKRPPRNRAVGELANHRITDFRGLYVYACGSPTIIKQRSGISRCKKKHRNIFFYDAFAPNSIGLLQPRTQSLRFNYYSNTFLFF